jgi:methanethiol S-methyltransferase
VRTMFSFLYGLIAYLACTATLLYLMGFSANLIVPRSVDVGASVGGIEAVAIDALLLLLFGVQHSVMARRGFKRWWTQVVPPVIERSTYVVATCLVLAVMAWCWQPVTEPIVWHIEQPVLVQVLWGLFGLGWVIALLSTYLIDHFELFGLRQVYAALVRQPLRETGFKTPVLYLYVRHPLYAGMLLSFWSVPTMTFGRLLFSAGMTLYVLIGIAFEERDLLDKFGERYRAYRAQVGMLVPRLRAFARRERRSS